MRDAWVETTLGDVAEWWSGGTPKAREPKYYENGTIPWAVIADMNKGIIDSTNSYITKEALELIGGRLAPVGSVLISMYASVGKSAIANIPLATNQAIAWSIPNQKKIIPFYLYLVSQQLEKEISDLARGATQRNINRQMLREFTFQLPPLPEQKRIVDLISSVDAYIEALQRQLERAKKSRAAVLYEVLTARGDGWTETTFGGLAQVTSGFAFSTNSWRDEGIPVIKINNVRDGAVSLDKCSFISEPVPAGASKFLLKKGDLLITLTGEIGAIGFVSQSQPMYLNQRVGLIKVRDPERVSLAFLGLFLTLPQVRAEMWSHAKGNAQLNISPTSIHSLNVDLPPISDQERMVDLVSSMDEVVNAVERTLEKSKNLRLGLLSDLLSGEHDIPASYDKIMDAA